jgi:hypothetical protein
MMASMTELLSDEVPAGKGVMSYLTQEDGDLKVTWDRENPEDVRHARRTFDDLKARGYLAYRVEPRGREPERVQVRQFDPDDRQLVLVPPLRGG